MSIGHRASNRHRVAHGAPNEYRALKLLAHGQSTLGYVADAADAGRHLTEQLVHEAVNMAVTLPNCREQCKAPDPSHSPLSTKHEPWHTIGDKFSVLSSG